jgi:hypothetical protein
MFVRAKYPKERSNDLYTGIKKDPQETISIVVN